MATTFKYIPEGGMTLTPSQQILLLKMEMENYNLEDFGSISELRSFKGYKVVISDKASFETMIRMEIEVLKQYAADLRKNRCSGSVPDREARLLAEVPYTIIESLEDLLERLDPKNRKAAGNDCETRQADVRKKRPLLGLYRCYDFSYCAPTVYLFKENIDEYALNHNILPDNVFAFVYVHEAMHAFYDSKNTKGNFAVKEMEEAFAECGMIDFLSTMLNREMTPENGELMQNAYDSVVDKQKDGPFEYGFGLSLQELSAKEGKTSDLMFLYREKSNLLRMPGAGNPELLDYVDKVSCLQLVPGHGSIYSLGAQSCYDLVKVILGKTYPNPPAFVFNELPNLEQAMREGGIISKARGSKASRTDTWKNVVCEPCSTRKRLYPLFGGRDYASVFSIVVRIIKAQGIDKQITVSQQGSYSNAVYHGKSRDITICRTENKYCVPSGDRRFLKETLFVEKGTEFVPCLLFGQCSGIQPSNPIEVLADWFGETLSIVWDACGVTVYGPSNLIYDIYSSSCTGGSGRDHTKYELTDLQGNHHANLSKSRLVQEGVRSYAAANPSATVSQLQSVFPKSLGWGPQCLYEVVMPVSAISPGHEMRYSKGIISASDGDFRVCNQWGITNIGNIITKLTSLGMTVK